MVFPRHGFSVIPKVVFTIASSQTDFNLATYIDANFNGAGSSSPAQLIVTIDTGVVFGSTSTGIPAFTMGSLYQDTTLVLINNGRIQGQGGRGGNGGSQAINGFPGAGGGRAFLMTKDVQIDNLNGLIWGGGGGGGGGAGAGLNDFLVSGGGGGGGGAGTGTGGGGTGGGQAHQNTGSSGSSGTADAGGAGGGNGDGPLGDGGAGGGPGLVGVVGENTISHLGGSGGQPGDYIGRAGFILTLLNQGDVRGTLS